MIGSLSGWAHGFAATVPLFADDPVTEEEVFHLSATAATIDEFDSYTAHVGDEQAASYAAAVSIRDVLGLPKRDPGAVVRSPVAAVECGAIV